jgi:uncharacterized protein YjbI with pentapeptide repeats
MLDGKTVMHYRTVRDTPVVSFAGAKLQNTRWKGTELLKVNAEGAVLEDAKPAVSFSGANISGADFNSATINGEQVLDVFTGFINKDGTSSKRFKVLFQVAW